MSFAARALDAADGVIDGRYYGRPIVQGGAPAYATAAPFATAVPAYAPQFVGAQAFPAQFGGYATSAPLIRSAVPSVIPGGNALALDAADGVIDGRYYGRPIVQGGAPVVGGVSAFGAAPFAQAPVYGGGAVLGGGIVNAGYYGAPVVRSVPTATVGSSALALDAADGVIDGRYYGRPIVQGGAPAASYFGGAPLLSGAVQPAFYQQPIFNSVVPTTQVLRTVPAGTVGSTAAALDAADGVIDGRYFGRPIVQGGRPF